MSDYPVVSFAGNALIRSRGQSWVRVALNIKSNDAVSIDELPISCQKISAR